MSVDAPLRDIPPGNGDEVPLDFSGMPALTVTGASLVEVILLYMQLYMHVHVHPIKILIIAMPYGD